MNARRSAGAASARLFLALWPDAAAAHVLAAERDRWTWTPAARPVPDERLHVTLHFLGPVARDRLPELAAALAVPLTPFALPFGRHALWRNGIAAYEPTERVAALGDLHRRLAGTLTRLALPVEERPYRPHVTMARDATGSTAPAPGDAWIWPIRDYALIESRPGGRYEVVALYR